MGVQVIRWLTAFVVGLALFAMPAAARAWTSPFSTGMCGGSSFPTTNNASVGVGWTADYCLNSTNQYGPLYSGYWDTNPFQEAATGDWLSTYSDMWGYGWAVIQSDNCDTGYGYVYYIKTGSSGSYSVDELDDANSTCVAIVAAGTPCATAPSGDSCTNQDIWAANGSTIYNYNDGANGWGFYSVDLGSSFNVKNMALFSDVGYNTSLHDLWAINASSGLYSNTTVHGRFGWQYSGWSTETLPSHGGESCDYNGMSLTQDWIECYDVGIFNYVSGSWSYWGLDVPYGGTYDGNLSLGLPAQIAYSSGWDALWIYVPGSAGTSSTAAIWGYGF